MMRLRIEKYPAIKKKEGMNMPNCCCCCCRDHKPNVNSEPVGNIILTHILQDGYVKADGQLLYRRDYPNLFQFASANNLLLSESEWSSNRQGMYAEGDGVNTFRVPDLRGQFLRALDDGAGLDCDRTLGSTQEDAIRNITGQIVGIAHFGAGECSGALSAEKTNIPDTDMDVTAHGSAVLRHNFDASRIVPTAEENRPKNIALIAQIKY